MIKFKQITDSATIQITIGKIADVEPGIYSQNKHRLYAYRIDVLDGRVDGVSEYQVKQSGFRSQERASAAAMLDAIAFANGGKSLKDLYFNRRK